jgi:hypothetical protein
VIRLVRGSTSAGVTIVVEQGSGAEVADGTPVSSATGVP